MLRWCREGAWGRLILDAPRDKNKLSIAFLERLLTVLTGPQAAGCRYLSLESTSDEIFAAGADMHELLALDERSAHAYSSLGQEVMNALESSRATVFALVSGPCFGGGFDLVLACHHIWATEKSVFCHPGAYLGILTGFGGTVRLPKRINAHMARHMLTTGYRLKASEGFRLGLVERVFPHGALMRRHFAEKVHSAGNRP